MTETERTFTVVGPVARAPVDPRECKEGDFVLLASYEEPEEPPFLSGMIVKVSQVKPETVVVEHRQYRKEVPHSALSSLSGALRETAAMNDGRERIALLTRARIFMSLHNNDAGAKQVERLMSLNPNDAEAHFIQAQLHINQSDLRRALASLDETLKNDTTHVRALIVRAALRNALNDSHAALQDINDAMRLDPENAYVYEALADIKLKQGNTAQAQLAAENVLRLHPESSHGHLIMGCTQMIDGDSSSAIESYSLAIRANPTDVSAYGGRAQAYVELEEYEAALQDAVTAVRMQPDGMVHRHMQAVILQKMGRLVDASRTASEGMAIATQAGREDGRARFLTLRGDIELQRANDCHETDRAYMAVVDYSEVLRIDAESAYARTRRADAFLLLNMDDKAMKDIETLLGSNPQSVDALYRRATIRQRNGDRDGALLDLQACNEIHPTRNAWVMTASIYQDQYRIALACDALRKAAEIEPYDDELRRMLADMERRLSE